MNYNISATFFEKRVFDVFRRRKYLGNGVWAAPSYPNGPPCPDSVPAVVSRGYVKVRSCVSHVKVAKFRLLSYYFCDFHMTD